MKRESMPASGRAMRYCIEGVLKTCSSLHMGSGEVVFRDDLVNENREGSDKRVEIRAHTMDSDGRACFYASSIKGALRSWASKRSLGAEDEILLKNLLGDPGKNENSQDGLGGLARFHDAKICNPVDQNLPLPLWDAHRRTWIEVSNTMDRHTRTTLENHLVHTECTPPDLSLKFKITGTFTEEQVVFLLALLDGFNDGNHPVLLGADTANGKGRVHWELREISCLDRASVLEWIRSPERGMASRHMQTLSEGKRRELAAKSKERRLAGEEKGVLEFSMTLRFDSLFLVNNPPLVKEEGEANHSPRLDAGEKVVLPATSFKGAFRSQAERILRTLGLEACQPGRKRAGQVCPSTLSKEEKKKELCIACRLFGATGWKSAVELTDFTSKKQKSIFKQEFVAIDRFTGGGKDGAKFNISAVYKPELKGKIRIHLSRLEHNGPELGLLALTLRDLMEGDITFGMGAAKGYGTCRAIMASGVWDRFLEQEETKKSFNMLQQQAEGGRRNE